MVSGQWSVGEDEDEGEGEDEDEDEGEGEGEGEDEGEDALGGGGSWGGFGADDVHGAVEFAARVDGDGAGGDVAIDGAVEADGDFAGGAEGGGDAGVDEHVAGFNGVGECDVGAFFDGEFGALDGAFDGAFGAEGGFAMAVDFGFDEAEAAEVFALDLGGDDLAGFADDDVTAGADGFGVAKVDVEVFEADEGLALGAVGEFGGAADFDFVAALEAVDVFEVLMAVGTLRFHFLQGAVGRGSGNRGGRGSGGNGGFRARFDEGEVGVFGGGSRGGGLGEGCLFGGGLEEGAEAGLGGFFCGDVFGLGREGGGGGGVRRWEWLSVDEGEEGLGLSGRWGGCGRGRGGGGGGFGGGVFPEVVDADGAAAGDGGGGDLLFFDGEVDAAGFAEGGNDEARLILSRATGGTSYFNLVLRRRRKNRGFRAEETSKHLTK